MEGQEGTLNNEEEIVDDSSTSAQESSPEFFDTMDLVDETVDDDASAETIKTDEDSEEDTAKAEAEAKAKAEAEAGDDETKDDETVPWHKDPRWQEFIAERNELRTFKERALKAEGKLEALDTTKDEKAVDGDFKNVAELDDEELSEWMKDKPKEFAANLLRQARSEIRAELLNEMDDRSHKDKVDATYKQYAKDNPDFMDKWNSGELRTYIDAHPGHNAISAYQVITSQSKETDTQKTVDEAVKKAVKETEARMTKNFKAKQGLQHLEGGSAGNQARIKEGIPPELKDTKKFGGPATVLTERLRQFRSKRQA